MKPATERAADEFRQLVDENLDSWDGERVKKYLKLAQELEDMESSEGGEPEPQVYEIPQVREIVVDGENPNDWAENKRVRVTTGVIGTAEEVTYKDDYGRERTVEQANGCDPDVPVVKGEYLEGGDREYSFPVTRLEKEEEEEEWRLFE